MARVWVHCREIVAACIVWGGASARRPRLRRIRGRTLGQTSHDRPALAVDPGMHTAEIWGTGRRRQGGVRRHRRRLLNGQGLVVADGKPLRTIWIPAGPEKVGDIYAVSISPDGRTIAAGGWTEHLNTDFPIYLFDREFGALVKRIHGDLPQGSSIFSNFSPDGRYLVATLGENKGIRVFDRNNDWHGAFRDDAYGRDSYGASFARDGRLATTSMDGKIRLYRYEPATADPNFRLAREPVAAPSDHEPYRIAFSPDGKRLAVGYTAPSPSMSSTPQRSPASAGISQLICRRRMPGQPRLLGHPTAGPCSRRALSWTRERGVSYLPGSGWPGRRAAYYLLRARYSDGRQRLAGRAHLDGFASAVPRRHRRTQRADLDRRAARLLISGMKRTG